MTGWASKVKNGQRLCSGKGAPPKITPEIMQKVEEFIESDVYLKQPYEIEEKYQELIDKDLEDRGLVPGLFKKVHKETIRRAKNDMNLTVGNAE